MTVDKYYDQLPHEMSGSMSKNRFREELLWGIEKFVDEYECASNEDFSMIFDYVCDIEVHHKNKLEFYQVKTNKNCKPYNCRKLIEKSSKNASGSILGKLYVLCARDDSTCNVKLAVVANVPYKTTKKTLSPPGELKFKNLPISDNEKIGKALKDELDGNYKVDEKKISEMRYIYTTMDLVNPKDAVMGKLMFMFEKIKGCEPSKPIALYQVIRDIVVEKACYEYDLRDYDAVIEKKGLRKKDFNEILEMHDQNARTGIKQTKQYIDGIEKLSFRRKCNMALSSLMEAMLKSESLKKIEKKIVKYIFRHEEHLTVMQDDILLLINEFQDIFPIEYNSEECKTVFCCIILNRWGEGAYNNENDI